MRIYLVRFTWSNPGIEEHYTNWTTELPNISKIEQVQSGQSSVYRLTYTPPATFPGIAVNENASAGARKVKFDGASVEKNALVDYIINFGSDTTQYVIRKNTEDTIEFDPPLTNNVADNTGITSNSFVKEFNAYEWSILIKRR